MTKSTRDFYHKYNFIPALLLIIFLCMILSGCQDSGSASSTSVEKISSQTMQSKFDKIEYPTAPGTLTEGNDLVSLDCSNLSEGYLGVLYKGSCSKVKLQIVGSNETIYTYNLPTNQVYLPLTSGDGSYKITVFENVKDDQYSTAFSTTVNASIKDPLLPFIYSNMYVDYADAPNTVSMADDLQKECTSDLEYIGKVYHYIIENISYDEEEAKNVAFDYLPVLDEVLSTKKGICFDYAALMAGMLRAQGIPTRMEVGYAGEAYHAWISTYIEDIGWIDKIIQFDGHNWSLMDPTFASSQNNSKAIQKFIGDGNNYNTLYTY